MSDEVGITVNGATYSGWKTTRVTRSIESLAGSFELSVSEKWAGQGQSWPINEEDECVVSIGADALIYGVVDSRKPSFSRDTHALTVSGKDHAAALVECSADLDDWEIANADLVKFAKKLCDPHGLKVSVQPGLITPGGSLPLMKKLAVSVGDKGFDALEHACRLAGVFAISSGDHEIVLTRAGSDRAATDLVQGENLLAVDGEFDASGRYATYKVLGQHATWKELNGAAASQIIAKATDPNVKRSSRTLIVRPEGNVTAEYAKRRVQWEANVRAARSDSVTATVQGWRMGDGQLWPINALVRVKSSEIRVDGDMLISQATYTVSEEGRITVLTLRRPDAFKPEPMVATDALWKEIDSVK